MINIRLSKKNFSKKHFNSCVKKMLEIIEFSKIEIQNNMDILFDADSNILKITYDDLSSVVFTNFDSVDNENLNKDKNSWKTKIHTFSCEYKILNDDSKEEN